MGKPLQMKSVQLALIAIGGGILCILIIFEVIALPPDESLIIRTPLLNGTEDFKRWSSVKYLKSFYIFNTTNPDQVRKGEPPILKECGPYVYADEEVKSNFKYSENGTVSYNLSSQPLRFRPDLSAGFESEEVVVPQDELVMAAHLAKVSEYSHRKVTAARMKHPQENALFVHITAGEIIKGRHSPFLETYWKSIVGHDLDGELSSISIKYRFRESHVEEVEIGGGSSLQDIGQNVRFEPISTMSVWRAPCDTVKGTTQTVFPPNIHRGAALQVFSPHWLRPFKFKYDKQVVVGGIDAYRFTLQGEELEYSQNSCYCDDSSSVEEDNLCPVNGTLRLYSHFHYPTTQSFPHFLFGTKELFSSVRGLEPNQERHQSYIDIEPVTGIVLSSHIRTQENFNLFPHNLTNVAQEFGQVPEVIYPYAWWDQAYELTDEAVKDALRRRDIPLSRYLGAGKWVLWVVALAALSSGFLLNKMRNSSEDYQGRDAVLMSDIRTDYDE